MIIGKFDFEIEAKLLSRLRVNRNCEVITGFTVLPDGSDGRWQAQPLLKPASHLSFDGERAVTQAIRELGCRYRLRQRETGARSA